MEKQTGKNSISSKQYNRGLCLKLIATGVCNTRIELSRKTMLAKMTVSNIVSEFLERDIVMECEEEPTKVCGRNPVILRLSEKAPKVVGLLIFRDRIEAVLGNLNLDIIRKESISFQELTEEKLKEYCCTVVDRVSGGEDSIIGMGVSSIGPVDIRHGIILNPTRFYGIRNVDIIRFLREKYQWPVCFDHDNNGAALAEKLYGIGKNEQDFLFLGISNGIGSGIISGGEVYHNQNGLAPEAGHISINYKGERCECGNRGCLEKYASSYIVLKKLQEATGQKFTFEEFCRMGDNAEVDAVFRQMVEDISAGAVNIVNILHPEMIVLGHDCIDWDEKYVNYMEELINERKVARSRHRIAVRKAFFGRDAQLKGAMAIVVNQIFKGELMFS
ncbi:MAG: ROK family protein [Lachnospiraceae bacterium]|nr:ROK family protein [Lachnospiraceae bacterium]